MKFSKDRYHCNSGYSGDWHYGPGGLWRMFSGKAVSGIYYYSELVETVDLAKPVKNSLFPG